MRLPMLLLADVGWIVFHATAFWLGPERLSPSARERVHAPG
jgi:hypothetical protein